MVEVRQLASFGYTRLNDTGPDEEKAHQSSGSHRKKDEPMNFDRYFCTVCGCSQRSGTIEVYRLATQRRARKLIALAFAAGIALGAWICALIMC